MVLDFIYLTVALQNILSFDFYAEYKKYEKSTTKHSRFQVTLFHKEMDSKDILSIGRVGLDVNVNFNINDNKVIDLAGTGPYIRGGIEDRSIMAEGHPMNTLWGYRTAGLFQTKEEVASYPTRQAGIAPGDIKYVDLNGDGKLTPDDMTYLGRTFPRYSFGGVFILDYKSFTLSALLQGVAGVKTRIGGAINQMGIWGGFTRKIVAGNYWTPENTNARFPRPLKFDIRNDEVEDRSLRDGAYLRLKNTQLAYQIPPVLTNRAGVNRISVYVAATNLLTFANLNEWNVDPETILGGRTEVYPQTSLYTFGLNVQF